MKRAIITIVLLLLSGLAFAGPDAALSATAPTLYEDNTVIDPNADTLTYTVWCGNTTGARTFMYDADGLTDAGATIDIAACVQGQVGTYYFVATATSSLHGTTSVYSNETTRFYGAGDLGKTPNAPTLLIIGMNAEDFVFEEAVA